MLAVLSNSRYSGQEQIEEGSDKTDRRIKYKIKFRVGRKKVMFSVKKK